MNPINKTTASFFRVVITFFVLSLITFSCTVQKRVHQKGYYVSWQGKKSSGESFTRSGTSKQAKHTEEIKIPLQTTDVTAPGFKSETKTQEPKQLLPENDSCDVLLYKDGSKIYVKLIEIGEREVRYKRCDNPDGPVYVSSKAELYMIKHRNGQEELVRVEELPRRQPTIDPSTYPRKTDYKNRRVVHPAAPFSLAFGILSLIVGYAYLLLLLIGAVQFTFIFAVLALAVIAVVMGRRAMSDIRNDPQHYKGKGLAMPGLIFGLVVCGIIATIGLFVLLLA